MTVLVFGGSSQIGHFLMPLLCARGEPVVAVSRGDHPDVPGLRWYRGQLPDSVPVLPDISAIISFGPVMAVADWLAAAQLPLAPRVIVTSSMSAESKRFSEVPAERAISQYLRDGEAAIAQACAKHGCSWTVLRPTLIYGAGLDKSLTPVARRAMRTHVFALPQGAGLRQPIHAEDIALAVMAVLDSPESASKILSIGGGERLTSGEMFARVRRSLSVTTLPIPLPAWVLRVARRVFPRFRGPLSRLDADLIADNDALTQLLGVKPRPFRPDADCWRSAA